MNELVRYEQILNEQLSNIPLPDENFAWDKMAKLLQDDEDDIILPPPVSKGCFIGGLLFIILIIIASWFFIPSSKSALKDKNDKEKISENKDHYTFVIADSKKMKDSIGKEISKEVNQLYFTDSQKNLVDSVLKIIKVDKIKIATSKDKLITPSVEDDAHSMNKNNFLNKDIKTNGRFAVAKKIKPKKIQKKSALRISSVILNPVLNEVLNGNNNDKQPLSTSTIIMDSLDNLNKKIIDTVNNKLKAVKNESENKKTDTTQKKKDDNLPAKKYFSFAAGVAIQQGIPINGESTVPYNYYGRKGAITDYIPSIYFRVYSNKKWFIQQEFKYGVPQYAKEYIYRTKVIDTTVSNKTTAYSLLKKTYYHQLPLSINYFVKPNWSIGAGIIFNKFVSAISRQDIRKVNANSTTDTLISSVILKENNDSVFTKNNFQWLIESQYRWKHFSLGIRYSRDVKPYIEFVNNISGIVEKKRNYAIHIFVRYELWKSKQKK